MVSPRSYQQETSAAAIVLIPNPGPVSPKLYSHPGLHGAEVKIILFETSLDFKSSRIHLGRTSKGMIFKMEDLLLNERCFIF